MDRHPVLGPGPTNPTHPTRARSVDQPSEDWESAPSSAVGPLPWDTTEAASSTRKFPKQLPIEKRHENG